MPVIDFYFEDFAFSFLSILLEGIPFVLLGTLLSGVIDAFLPSKLMTRFLPRNVFAAIGMAGVIGLLFPMCECGIVPVIRRLIKKGLPVSSGITYMLAAPIVNPVVIISTYAAFRGQNPLMIVGFRLLLGFMVAVLAGLIAHRIAPKYLLQPGILPEESSAEDETHHHQHDHTHTHSHAHHHTGARQKWATATRVTIADFLDVSMYLIIGAAITSVFNTAIDQSLVLPLAMDPLMATVSMMGLAGILSLCSTSDAFIAATFVTFPVGAKLAFMVFGPMMDLKLVFLYSAVFRKRFVILLAFGLLFVIGRLCVTLSQFHM